MPEYLSPGVYVEEVDTGSKTIEGVSTSTAGFVGMTNRGAASGLPQLVTSYADFQRKYGGYFNYGTTFAGYNYMPYAVEGFFNNGGKRLYIMRVLGTAASVASETTLGGITTRILSDAASTATTFKPATLRAFEIGTHVLLVMVKDGVTTMSPVVDVTAIDTTTGVVTVSAALGSSFEARYTTVQTSVQGIDGTGAVVSAASPAAVLPITSIDIEAANEGSWGLDISIQTFHQSAARANYVSLEGGNPSNSLRLTSGAGFYVGAWVEIFNGDVKVYRRITAVAGVVITVDGAAIASGALTPVAPATTTIVSTCEFGLIASYDGVVEQYSGLTLENVTGRYCMDEINNNSNLIVVTAVPGSTDPTNYPCGTILPASGLRSTSESLRIALTGGGSDGTGVPAPSDYVGIDNGPGTRTGLKALEDIDQISIIAVPGITDQTVQNAMIEQCERLKDRFTILDPENKQQSLDEIIAQRQLFDTKYAAIYYPRITVLDPLTDLNTAIPPSGHIAGIYARTDIERGVHKAPANEVIRGITGLDLTINKGEQDILNPSPVNVNVLRDFRTDGRGYRVWGARCITSDTDWKYVNVRRLFIFIEESIDQGTQWVVFEPNDEPLWARVRRSVSNFLTNVWRDGALQGKKPEEAFFVRCDRTTMSQDDIDNGRLIMLIGIAPVKPAEFVIFRIGQWTGGSAVDE